MENKKIPTVVTCALAASLACAAIGPCIADITGDQTPGTDLVSVNGTDQAVSGYLRIISENPGTDMAADATFKLGELYQGRRQHALALQWFMGALKTYPKYALRANFQIGYCYQDQGKYPEAITALVNGIQSAPASTPKGDFYLKYMKYRLGECYRASEKWDEAITLSTTLSQDYPEDAADHRMDLATCYKGKKNWNQAIEQYTAIKQSYPDKATNAQFWIGYCYHAQKKYPEAISALETAANMADATSADDFQQKSIKYRLGECYRQTENWEKGIALYSKLVSEFPEDAGEHKYDLACCYQGNEDYDRAITILNDVAANYPDKAKDALLRVADCMGDEGKHTEEIAFLNQLYDEHQDFRDEILFSRAVVRSDFKKEFTEAIADLREIMSDYPNSRFARDAKLRVAGLTLHGLNNTAGARSLLEAFLAEYPNSEQKVWVIGDLATCSYLEKDYAKAGKLFEEALSLYGPEEWRPLTLYMTGDAYSRAENKTKAKEMWNTLISEYPEDSWTMVAKGMLAMMEANR